MLGLGRVWRMGMQQQQGVQLLLRKVQVQQVVVLVQWMLTWLLRRSCCLIANWTCIGKSWVRTTSVVIWGGCHVPCSVSTSWNECGWCFDHAWSDWMAIMACAET
jgi:hypothetical protein